MLHGPSDPLGQTPLLFPLAEAQSHAFIVSRYREPTAHFLWHFHPETELVWTRSGRGLRYVGEAVEAFQAGDLVLLGGSVPHTWSSAPDHRRGTDWTVIHFRPESWGSLFWHLPELRPVNQLLTNAARGLQFTGPGRWEVGQRVEALARSRPHCLAGISRFLDILRLLGSLGVRPLNAHPAAVPKSKAESRFQQALDLVHQRAHEALTQAEVAGSVGLSPAAFSRWFKQHSGRVFQRYRNEVRVANVCAHLAAGGENVTEAAGACGYNNLANFYRRFREITGLTPREFRRLNHHQRQQRAHELVVRLGRHHLVRIAPPVAQAPEPI